MYLALNMKWGKTQACNEGAMHITVAHIIKVRMVKIFCVVSVLFKILLIFTYSLTLMVNFC